MYKNSLLFLYCTLLMLCLLKDVQNSIHFVNAVNTLCALCDNFKSSSNFQTPAGAKSKNLIYRGLYFALFRISCASAISMSCVRVVSGCLFMYVFTICQPVQLAVRPGASWGMPGEPGL
jgi:hypothetical protein